MVCEYLEGLLHLQCVPAIASHNLSELVVGTGHIQNEEITVILLSFILGVLVHRVSGVKVSGFSYFRFL